MDRDTQLSPQGGYPPTGAGVRPRIPRSTYRLQFHRNFGFAQALRLVPYLSELGISDLYASPLLGARRGSDHGYDMTDPTRLNTELGTNAEFEALVKQLHRHDMGLLLDFVPNHMAADQENPWWTDVLEHGPASRFAGFFDIDWARGPGGNTIVLPVLGLEPGEALQSGQLGLGLEPWERRGSAPLAAFFIRYFDRRFPVVTSSWSLILSALAALSHETSSLKKLAELLAENESAGEERVEESEAGDPRGQARRAKALLAAAWTEDTVLPEAVRRAAAGVLPPLLQEQHYRLAHFRSAAEELNYRRFFDISDLVGLRQEVEEVFDTTHAFLLELVATGRVTGLRLDHVDGLWDPLGYLEGLRRALGRAAGGWMSSPPHLDPGPPTTRSPEGLPGRGSEKAQWLPLYVLVEKILSGDEALRRDWPVHGTTGYDFLNDLGRLFVDPLGMEQLDQHYRRLSPQTADFQATRYEAKRLVLQGVFAGEMRALSDRLSDFVRDDPETRTLSTAALSEALLEITTCLPVYRTYIRGFDVADEDRKLIDLTVNEAQRRNAGRLAAAFAYLRRLLSLSLPQGWPEERRAQALELVMRWQQMSGPAMAKGLEDTAFYRFNRLISLDEVGGDPEVSPGVRDALHRRNLAVAEDWPATMNASSTHDTKRSEDVRARIDVLSEIPEEWMAKVERWSTMNEGHRRLAHGRPVPDANDQLLLYQTLVGAWPLQAAELEGFEERLGQFLVKAAREEKEHTSWLEPDADYEEALRAFLVPLLQEPAEANPFLADFLPFQARVAWYGALNSLSQTLLKTVSPGVPDFYQGTELWDLSLVDPDNRRPVDFSLRKRLLDEVRALGVLSDERPALCRRLLASWRDGRVKLFLIREALAFRGEHERLLLEGGYLPLEIRGPQSRSMFAFARHLEEEWLIAAVPRLLTGLVPPEEAPLGRAVWGSTVLVLPPGVPSAWQDVLTGVIPKPAVSSLAGAGRAAPRETEFPLAGILTNLPLALLYGTTGP